MQEKLQETDKRKIKSLALIFTTFYILTLLFQSQILPSLSININDLTLPAFQTTQTLIVFPLILFISYFFFIRKGFLNWQDLGFNKGKNGLLLTIILGLLGGLAIGFYNYFAMDYFLLQKQIAANFIEKCLFAPIWEEFFNRVLFLSIIEFTIIGLANKYYFENPKYKNKLSEKSKKKELLKYYFIILFIGAWWFVWFHGIWISSNILFGGMIMGAVYLRSRSIIAPIIVHSMSNFVTGGFLFLIIHNLGI